MAHVLVYLQRSPRGLHPASSVALCVARDIGSTRGASVLGICPGDAGPFDDHMVAAAGKAGADQVIFVGPSGLRALVDRLRPKHVLMPWTPEAGAAAESSALDAPTPAWIGGPVDDISAFRRNMYIVAGSLPWHHMPGGIEAEFEGQVDQSVLPDWIAATGGAPQSSPGLYYVGPQDLDDNVRAGLANIGAQPVAPDYAMQHQGGTLLWLDAGPTGLPEALATRSPAARVIALPGPLTEMHTSWTMADWVIPGPWDAAVHQLSADHWRAALM